MFAVFLGLDIPVEQAEARNDAGAARILRERNPFSKVCGYACAAGDIQPARIPQASTSSSDVPTLARHAPDSPRIVMGSSTKDGGAVIGAAAAGHRAAVAISKYLHAREQQ